MLEGCHWLEQADSLWQDAGDLGYALRRKGLSVKTFDLLIAAYALGHDTQLLTTDGDFSRMQKKGVRLQLVPLTP